MNELQPSARYLKWLLVLAVPCFAAILIAIMLVRGYRHVTSQHYRPGGHQDITFDISPDGERIVLNAVGDGGMDLYLMDLKTFEVSRIAATPEYEVAPSFSPDGKSVVYAAGRRGDRADHLFIRSLDGSQAKQITAEDANDCSPAFSPDGSLIVFARDWNYNSGWGGGWGGVAANWSGGGAICIIRPDGSGFRRITSDPVPKYDPHLSPDGKTILFWSSGVFTVSVDGSDPPSEIWNGGGLQAVFSPDGEQIAFSKGKYERDYAIFLMRVDRSNLRQLTNSSDGCFHPVFMPDGKDVLHFVHSWPTGATGVPKYSLWSASVETGKARRLADYGLFDDPLHWRP